MWKNRIQQGPCSGCNCPDLVTKAEAANRCPYLGPPLDFVYLYIHSPADGEELRYSIRSVFKNYLGPARIWVVGDKPEWYSGLHVPLKRIRKKNGQARLDRAHKFYYIATQIPEINDRFVAMQDDIYFVNPLTYYDLNRRWVNGKPLTPEQVLFWHPDQGYLKQKLDTAKALFERGTVYVSDYSTHTPKFYYKADLKNIIEEFEALKIPLICTILFDNAIQREDRPFPVQPFRIRLKSKDHTAQKVLEKCKDKMFLNHVEESWNEETSAALAIMFPNKSEVEL